MTDMAITTTSVSFALTIKALLPSIAACRACTKIRESASSCVHGAKSSNAITRLQQTSSSFVTMTKHGVSASDNRSARKWKRSVLLLLSLIIRKLFQFWGVLLVGVTLLRIPLPLLDRASTFRLDPLYTSNTMSNLWYFVEYDLTLGRMSSLA